SGFDVEFGCVAPGADLHVGFAVATLRSQDTNRFGVYLSFGESTPEVYEGLTSLQAFVAEELDHDAADLTAVLASPGDCESDRELEIGDFSATLRCTQQAYLSETQDVEGRVLDAKAVLTRWQVVEGDSEEPTGYLYVIDDPLYVGEEFVFDNAFLPRSIE
ncbi:MAG: hypothetical protein KC561_17760, partial [Myxococcales bacterium]|nr:hypothetical protein [Myxococcales bacterium]